MGNAEVPSSNKYGKIQVDFDFPFCVPNKQYEGMLQVKIFQYIAISAVEIEFYGEECTLARVTNGSDITNKGELLRHIIPLSLPNVNGIVKPGEYSLPFSFRPPNLINSFPKTNYQNMVGHIEYFCIANVFDDTKKLMLQSKRLFKFINPISSIDNYPLSREDRVTGWFGKDKGICKIGVVLGKTAVYSGEPLNVNVDLDCTNCAVRMKSLKCYLYQETFFTHVKEMFNIMPTRSQKVKSWTLQGVGANQKISYVHALTIPVSFYDGYGDVQLRLVDGHLIRQKYLLVFKPDFGFPFHENNMQLESHIGVCPVPASHFVEEIPNVAGQLPLPFLGDGFMPVPMPALIVYPVQQVFPVPVVPQAPPFERIENLPVYPSLQPIPPQVIEKQQDGY